MLRNKDKRPNVLYANLTPNLSIDYEKLIILEQCLL